MATLFCPKTNNLVDPELLNSEHMSSASPT